jgi:hypothetical protein
MLTGVTKARTHPSLPITEILIVTLRYALRAAFPLLLTFLLVTDDSQHTATVRSASSPMHTQSVSHLPAGRRSSIAFMISSAHRTASAIALIVAGTRFVASNCASLRAARILAAINSTRLRPRHGV